MMVEAKKRKGIENYQLLELRKVVKENGDSVMKYFRDKYRELKIESNRGKTAETSLWDNRVYRGRDIMNKE